MRLTRWILPAIAAVALSTPAVAQDDDGWFDWNWNDTYDYQTYDGYDDTTDAYDYDYTRDYGYGNRDLADEEMDDVEWDRQWGYHEEEWYDPSDWFDADAGVEYEDDAAWGSSYTDYGYGDYYDGEDQFGYYNTDYDWETDDASFEDWYGDADDDWNWF